MEISFILSIYHRVYQKSIFGVAEGEVHFFVDS